MAEIAPLTPLRYDLTRLKNGLAGVVAPPYDVIDAAEREGLLARDPYNIVRLILPDGDGDAKSDNAAQTLASWRHAGVLARDVEPAFYRYDQTFLPPSGGAKALMRRGFFALVRLTPLSGGVVLPHERTLSGPKADRLKLFRSTRTNLSPGFMLYRDPRGELDAPLDTADVHTEFSTPDGIHHVVARVVERDAVRSIIDAISRSSLLIADGHHRYETALAYGAEVDAANPSAAHRAEHHYFMTFLANGDDPNLVVFPTHRHVHSLGALSFDDLLARAREHFTVRELERGAHVSAVTSALEAAGQGAPSFAAAAADGRTAILTLRNDVDLATHPTLGARPDVVRKTDVAVLHSAVLEHLLGITPEAQAAKTNLWYPQDAGVALGDVRAGRGQVLFLMNATPVGDVRRVAEAGEVMPQKSTFFYPKVLTGIALHTLEPTREVAAV